VLVGLGTAANVIRHESVPMFIETMLLLVGAGALVPWDERRQAALGAFCLAAFAADQALAPMPDAYAHIRWLAMLGAVLVAQIAVHLSSLYRRELAAHCRALAAAREQALLASRAKSEFLSTISHEVRTPMNSVLGVAEVLAETNLDGDQRRYLETLRSNGSAMMKLLGDILDLAKVETGRLHLRNEEFDLAELVEKTVESFAMRAKSKGLKLAARIVPGTPSRLMGDLPRLRQVLTSLLGNAIKFTESGSVELTVAAGNDRAAGRNATADTRTRAVRFSVADTGIGIESAKLAEIFASFTQADASDARRYGGSGLGLAIASQLATLMGGRITVESAPGRGSTFHFIAPLEVADAAAEAAPAHDLNGTRVLAADLNDSNRRVVIATPTGKPPESKANDEAIVNPAQPNAPSPPVRRTAPPTASATRPLRVLFAEDSSDNRLLITAYFKHLPYQVETAENGKIAVDKFVGGRYDLVLMDMQMPVMDGYAAVSLIRTWEREHHLARRRCWRLPHPRSMMTSRAPRTPAATDISASQSARLPCSPRSTRRWRRSPRVTSRPRELRPARRRPRPALTPG
jgi:signal transduction histidine kinase